MIEMSASCENHRYAQLIRSIDHRFIIHRTTRLHDRFYTNFSGKLDSIRKREERVRRHNCSNRFVARHAGRQIDTGNSIRLTGAHSD